MVLNLGIVESIKGFPSAVINALKDYFSGLGLFFNRKTWSHGVIFIVILAVFLAFHIFQRWLVSVFQTIVIIIPTINNVLSLIYLSGCGVFVGFLLLGAIALTSKGRNLLYQSRFRHLVSPLVISGFILFFITIIPFIFSFFPASPIRAITYFIVGPSGFLNYVYSGCWVTMVILQVVLLGFTIVTTLKWFWSYVKVPEYQGTATKHRIGTVLLLFLVPLVIFFWPFLVYLVLVGVDPPFQIIYWDLGGLPIFFQVLLGFDRILYQLFYWVLSPVHLVGPIWWFGYGYQLLLWSLTPVVFATSLVVLWRGRSQLALALAGFGVLYSALVFYYHYRVYQYFINVIYIATNADPRSYIGTMVFEIVLILITFLMCLQGVAKYQREYSANPFGLFALMIGTLLFFQVWMISPGLPAWFQLESFSLVSAALSALIASTTFIMLPIAYGFFRLRYRKESK